MARLMSVAGCAYPSFGTALKAPASRIAVAPDPPIQCGPPAPRGVDSACARIKGMTVEHDQRPWGSYTVLDDQAGHKVKRIMVSPGCRLSYQRHEHRSEHWFVVAGTGRITLEGAEQDLVAGEAVDILAGVAHRIGNPGDSELVFIEVQHGSYFGEDDIVRLEDDYGRVG